MPKEQSGRRRATVSHDRTKAGKSSMPKNASEEVSAQAAGISAAADRGAHQLLNVPRPTKDQQLYLERIQVSSGDYDPNIVICGTKRD
ncbi:hypothetical protein [Methylobacterium sp. WCS2018Hpa-22]|uniref:hypothetical protein n=1 Tax=Methylobacterium sp. WCS2018Hpa-22 TaxID=3073633 RepID=UPI00288C2178|nr:hypothetical protein [Methylobacterium sp. WCS2018Hpa-22]